MDAGEDVTEDVEKIAQLRGALGILVLSARCEVLHINGRGWELIHDFDNARIIKTSGGMLPCVVSEVFEDLQRIAREQFADKDVTLTEVRRIGAATPHPILVRGLMLPGSRSGLQSKVLILLEVVGREEKTARHRKEFFRFTNRENMVLQNLAKGRTNKEIASDLNIAEQTVKAYIRQIMDKTTATTRTGILAQVLAP